MKDGVHGGRESGKDLSEDWARQDLSAGKALAPQEADPAGEGAFAYAYGLRLTA
jgi:hypothetical protein